ncbi:MAG: DNA-binding response regulator [Bacteroidales bacterium]|nr:DNA-binding response regulator [Bacteroidales bacterium]
MALNKESDLLKGIKTGAEAYIQKPFSTAVLITTICKMIEQRDRLKQAYAKEVVGKVPTPAILAEETDNQLRKQLDAWMQAHIDDPKLTIDAFAEHFGYGRSSFFKKFKQITGMTPNDYIREQRMSVAAELLKDPRLTVAEVAYKVGFEDQYYFSKAFKQHFGMPPTKYRNG